MATGTVTIVSDTGGPGHVRKIVLSCTANASGNVVSDKIARISGYLICSETTPDTVAVPTSYNSKVRRRSTTGWDMLGGDGNTRSTTATEEARPKDAAGNMVMAPCREDDLYVTADNCGNGGKFTQILYFYQEAA